MSDGPISPDQSSERDADVARALRSIPVPDHRPGFWTELESQLAVLDTRHDGPQHQDPELAPPDAAGMPPGRDGRELPMAEPRQSESRRWRRERQRRLLLNVAAVSVITAGGLALFLSRPDDRNVGPVDVPDPTTAATPVPTTVPEPPATSPEAALQEFVRTIGDDREAAFAMLTGESRESLGGPAQLAAGFGPEFSVWSAPRAVEQEAVMAARSPAGIRVAVVTYTGSVEVQGATQPRTQAFALVREGGAWRISLTASAVSESAGPAIDMISPADRPAVECCGIGGFVAAGEPIRFRAAVTPELPLVSVAFDGGEALDPAQLELADAVVTARPQLGAGIHVVTIAIVQPDGVVYARAVQFVVG
jgi:hypothetical protein